MFKIREVFLILSTAITNSVNIVLYSRLTEIECVWGIFTTRFRQPKTMMDALLSESTNVILLYYVNLYGSRPPIYRRFVISEYV